MANACQELLALAGSRRALVVLNHRQMKNLHEKLSIVLELLRLGERAFIFKLKKKNPEISDADLKQAVREWHLHRPGAELGDGEGVPGDPKRFD